MTNHHVDDGLRPKARNGRAADVLDHSLGTREHRGENVTFFVESARPTGIVRNDDDSLTHRCRISSLSAFVCGRRPAPEPDSLAARASTQAALQAQRRWRARPRAAAVMASQSTAIRRMSGPSWPSRPASTSALAGRSLVSKCETKPKRSMSSDRTIARRSALFTSRPALASTSYRSDDVQSGAPMISVASQE